MALIEPEPTSPMKCIRDAWQAYETELRRFLRHRAGDDATADDLLQELFLHALRQPDGLCGVGNPRAWLYQGARNLLIDRLRVAKDNIPLPDDMAADPEEVPVPVNDLSQCLPRVLTELAPQDREAITRCDIEGMTQQAYADRAGLTLPAAKARLRRARHRLRERLVEACQVTFDEAGQVCCFVPRPTP
jgi:RNA polymerase sigma-70 factor (ECF subfamily)